MFACDFLIANRDRHWNNFGFIRNVETLEWERSAPIFDSGSSFWSDVPVLENPRDYRYRAKPFGRDGMRPAQQLALFRDDCDWLDLDALEGYAAEAIGIMKANPNFTEQRAKAVKRGIEENIILIGNRKTNKFWEA